MAKNRPIDLSSLECCPKCESSWIDKPIPEHHQEYYGDKKWFSRVIALYDRDQDRTVAWQCPDCGTCWDRDTGMIRPGMICPSISRRLMPAWLLQKWQLLRAQLIKLKPINHSH